MSAADEKPQVELTAVESPKRGDAETPLVEVAESLRADVLEKLEIEEAEEAKLTPEVANPRTEETESAVEMAKPGVEETESAADVAKATSVGSPRKDVAEKPLIEQPEAERCAAEEVESPAKEAAKLVAKEEEPVSAEEHRRRVVLICFDDSEHSRRAVQFYVRGLSRPDDRVVMMHAIEAQEIILAPQPLGYVTPYASGYHENLTRMKSKMMAKGVELQALLKAAGLKSRIYLMDGPEKPGVYIVLKAARLDAQLIVIGSRGLGVLRRTFLGSVSDYVLHHAGCATCVVPPTRRS